MGTMHAPWHPKVVHHIASVLKGNVMRIWLGLLCHLSNDLVLLPVVFSIGFQLLNDSKAAFECVWDKVSLFYWPVVVPLFARVCSIIWEKHPKTSAKTFAQLTNLSGSGSTWVHPTHIPYRYFHSLSAPWSLLDFLWHFFVCLRPKSDAPAWDLPIISSLQSLSPLILMNKTRINCSTKFLDVRRFNHNSSWVWRHSLMVEVEVEVEV